MRAVTQGLWTTFSFAIALLGSPYAVLADDFGVRAGEALGNTGYSSQEIYWMHQLPIRLGNPENWHITSQGELNAGRVGRGGESLTTAGGAISLWLRPPSTPITVGIGTGPTYLSRTQLGDRDFGGHWQFTSHATARLALTPSLAIGYRIQHTSNAGFSSPNAGYNIQVLEVRFRF